MQMIYWFKLTITKEYPQPSKQMDYIIINIVLLLKKIIHRHYYSEIKNQALIKTWI